MPFEDPDLYASEAAEAAWVDEQAAEAKALLVECEKCGEQVCIEDTETVTIQTARQTHSDPAEYEDQVWCGVCRRRAEYLSDPEHEAYERARANGWAD